jgi:hypothetical protein
MTREEFYSKYGDVQVTFSHYYKFTFHYSATLPDGKHLTVGYGGNHDEIYRHEVSKDTQEKIRLLEPYMGSVYNEGKEIEDFYDY